jgi:hypothetical protein
MRCKLIFVFDINFKETTNTQLHAIFLNIIFLQINLDNIIKIKFK